MMAKRWSGPNPRLRPSLSFSAGMAASMAPATGAIMSSVPLNKAGVGSAVNDTTRELGGALGIAILGSIVTSSYRVEFDATRVPDGFGAVAEESVGGAIGVARQIGGVEGARLVERAGVAFTDAISTAFFVSAVISVVAGIVVVATGRRSARAEALRSAT